MSAADPAGLLKRSELENEYTVEIKQNIDRFGEVLVLKNAEGHRIMAKEKRPSTIEDCKRDIHQAFERLKLNHQHLLRMYDYSVMYVEDHFVIRGYYELADANLAIELEERREAKAFFAAEELRNLLIDILEIVSYLKEKKMIHGDIRPEYVMFDADSQIYKLADRLGDPSPPTKVQAKNIIRGRKLYLSPQLFFNLVHQTRGTPNFEAVRLNPYLSEGYSIGLLILEAALLEDCQNIYDLELGQIDEAALQEKLAMFAENYQDQDVGLVRAVQDLLETSEEERPDLQLLLTGLKSTPQNSDNEEEPENLIFDSDRDRQGGVIEEVEEEDDQSTQHHAIQSSFRQQKMTDENYYKEDRMSKESRSPGSSKAHENAQPSDSRTKNIMEFKPLASNLASQKDSHRDQEKTVAMPKSSPVRAEALIESGFDLILKEESKVPPSKAETFGFDYIKQSNSVDAYDQRTKFANIGAKESKPESKTDTKTNSVSQEIQSDAHSSLKQLSREDFMLGKVAEVQKQINVQSKVASDSVPREVSTVEATKHQLNQKLQFSKNDEEQEWERSLAEIKFKRDEVLQNLQNLKNIHQDFYKSEELNQSQGSKHVPNIFKEEFASGHSLHQLTPTQHVYTKVDYDSGVNSTVNPRETLQTDLKREPDSNKQHSTQATNAANSKPSSNNQLTPQMPEVNNKEDTVEKSKFDYKFDRYLFNTQGQNTVDVYADKENQMYHPKSEVQRQEDPRAIKQNSQKKNIADQKQSWEPKEDMMVTPKRHEILAVKQANTQDNFAHEQVKHQDRTPTQKPIQKNYEQSTQFRAIEETPQNEVITVQASRVMLDAIKRTSPFTTLKPGDVLISSSQKINPTSDFSSNLYKHDSRMDSTPIRDLPQPSSHTETRELSSFNISSQETTEKRIGHQTMHGDGHSPILSKYEPQPAVNFKKDYFATYHSTTTTPPVSTSSLYNAQMPQTRDVVTTRPNDIKFKPANPTTPNRELTQVSDHAHAPAISRDISPRPAPVVGPLPPGGKTFNPIVILSQSRADELKPIVIRSRSTTPIKNAMQSINGVAESISYTVSPSQAQPQPNRLHQSVFVKNSYEQATPLPHDRERQLEAIFQTGHHAPAYRSFHQHPGKEYYELVNRIGEHDAATFKTTSNMLSSNSVSQHHTAVSYPTNPTIVQRSGQEMTSSVYLPAYSGYQTANTAQNHSQQQRSLSPLQSSLLKTSQDRGPAEHTSNHGYPNVFSSQVGYGTNQSLHSTYQNVASHQGYPAQRNPVLPQGFLEQSQRSRTPVIQQQPAVRQGLASQPTAGGHPGNYFATSRYPAAY